MDIYSVKIKPHLEGVNSVDFYLVLAVEFLLLELKGNVLPLTVVEGDNSNAGSLPANLVNCFDEVDNDCLFFFVEDLLPIGVFLTLNVQHKIGDKSPGGYWGVSIAKKTAIKIPCKNRFNQKHLKSFTK